MGRSNSHDPETPKQGIRFQWLRNSCFADFLQGFYQSTNPRDSFQHYYKGSVRVLEGGCILRVPLRVSVTVPFYKDSTGCRV